MIPSCCALSSKLGTLNGESRTQVSTFKARNKNTFISWCQSGKPLFLRKSALSFYLKGHFFVSGWEGVISATEVDHYVRRNLKNFCQFFDFHPGVHPGFFQHFPKILRIHRVTLDKNLSWQYDREQVKSRGNNLLKGEAFLWVLCHMVEVDHRRRQR